MMTNAAQAARLGGFSEELTASAAGELRSTLGGTSTIAFAFCTPDYAPWLGEFCEILRVAGHVLDVVGCTGAGFTGGASATETGSGFSVLATALPGLGSRVVPFQGGRWPEAPSPDTSWIALATSVDFDIESWLADWFPKGAQVVGGVAGGPPGPPQPAVFHNGVPVDALAIEVSRPTRLAAALSQGCRPIGEPLTVTRAEQNVIYALGSRPAYEALESAFEGLTDKEKSGARGNLFAGLAGSEYIEEFRSRDFLVRSILGADPNSGAVAIGGTPRVGQTMQYQLRDAAAAKASARGELTALAGEWGRPAASIVFSCVERTKRFFGVAGHDAATVQNVLGPHPSAGLHCAGEIGPVADRACAQSYSLACAALYHTEPPGS